MCPGIEGLDYNKTHKNVNATMLVCNYSPPGNIKGTIEPYAQGASCAQCEPGSCLDNLCTGETVACRDVPATLTWNGEKHDSCAALIGNESKSVCFQWRDVGSKYCQR